MKLYMRLSPLLLQPLVLQDVFILKGKVIPNLFNGDGGANRSERCLTLRWQNN
jgi:hypothetical protein